MHIARVDGVPEGASKPASRYAAGRDLPAEAEAEKRRLLADAQAYEITKINDAIGKNPNYVKLQALKSLEAISKDPAAKIYFIDSKSSSPLPLMHLGDIK